MNYRSVQDLNEAIIKNLWMIPRDVRLVAGIPRSGLLAANLIALYLDLPLTDADGLLEGRTIRSGRRGTEGDLDALVPLGAAVLVVDDSILHGSEMRRQKARLQELSDRFRLYFAAVYGTKKSGADVDFVFEIVHSPRVFEWNLMHHGIIESSCMDIDGVLCADPEPDENDDGERYREFIRSAKPLLIPSKTVGWLVTSRLEKYRDSTEEWLKSHGVRYRELVMVNLPDKETRDRVHNHALFKGRFYKSVPARLFIESSRHQAPTIAETARKPALCVETGRMWYPSIVSSAKKELLQSPRTLVRKGKGLLRRIGRLLLGPRVR